MKKLLIAAAALVLLTGTADAGRRTANSSCEQIVVRGTVTDLAGSIITIDGYQYFPPPAGNVTGAEYTLDSVYVVSGGTLSVDDIVRLTGPCGFVTSVHIYQDN